LLIFCFSCQACLLLPTRPSRERAIFQIYHPKGEGRRREKSFTSSDLISFPPQKREISGFSVINKLWVKSAKKGELEPQPRRLPLVFKVQTRTSDEDDFHRRRFSVISLLGKASKAPRRVSGMRNAEKFEYF
jgi:hypothetical protein